jgi:bacillithiol synthase
VQPQTAISRFSRATALDIRRLPGIRRLAGDYVYHFDRLAEFFAGDPSVELSWLDAVRRAQLHSRPRAELAALLANQQRRRGAPPAAVSAAERLRDKRTVAVVTGQQAGLFGGPLYTLLKALTAVKLAARLSERHKVPTVAVFWIDAEDHDWDEIASCVVLDENLEPAVIHLPPPAGANALPVAAVHLEHGVTTALDQLAERVPSTEFTATLLTWLRSAYRPGAGVAEAFGRWMELTLGDLGLVVYDSSDPGAKQFTSHIFQRELQFPGESARLAATAGDELAARGYHVQVAPHLDSAALFHLGPERRPVRIREDHFAVGDREWSASELLDIARDHPERLSPNVLLRPIVQDSLFPTVCYVAGPNELAYLAQLRGIYEDFAVPMPLVYPRASVTLLDSAAARFLSKYGLPLEALQPKDEAALNRLLEKQLPARVEQTLVDAQKAVREGMSALVSAVPAIDPTLEGAARSTLGRMEHELETLHSKIINAAKRRDETLRRQFIRTRAQAFPDGQPQERTIAFTYFLNRYGPALVDRLYDELRLEPGYHWMLTV